MNISKELLSKVLEYKVFASISNDTNELKCLFVDLDKSKELRINIYELAHKCKEWAWSKGYILRSETSEYTGCCVYRRGIKDGFITKNIQTDTEIEAIFKACQWILENCKD